MDCPGLANLKGNGPCWRVAVLRWRCLGVRDGRLTRWIRWSKSARWLASRLALTGFPDRGAVLLVSLRSRAIRRQTWHCSCYRARCCALWHVSPPVSESGPAAAVGTSISKLRPATLGWSVSPLVCRMDGGQTGSYLTAFYSPPGVILDGSPPPVSGGGPDSSILIGHAQKGLGRSNDSKMAFFDIAYLEVVVIQEW